MAVSIPSLNLNYSCDVVQFIQILHLDFNNLRFEQPPTLYEFEIDQGCLPTSVGAQKDLGLLGDRGEPRCFRRILTRVQPALQWLWVTFLNRILSPRRLNTPCVCFKPFKSPESGYFCFEQRKFIQKYVRTWRRVRVWDSGEIAERDGSVRRARVDAEDCAGRNESARGRSHARVTRAAFGTRGLDADGVRTRQRHPRAHRASPRPGAGPASEPAATLARVPRDRRTAPSARKGARPVHPTIAQLAADPACIRYPRRVRGWDAHAHARPRHPRRVRTARTGGGGVRESENGSAGFPRSEPAAARMCTHSAFRYMPATARA
ncbi:hypothetical protein C8F04DRAFT_1188861 [Mycena alexandri]|uniref:Uncharacterized protein n=1 Tax=Mycena alexandri TaxID=1745969 RepID=A0AAD6X0W7_9AGAR|nr:hypothetical protein C8F04DRAFT_1188861 [Mycena alexandri]